MNAKEPSDIAVIVLASRAPPALADCVASLLAQEVAPEVLVVNSGGGDARARLAAQAPEIPVLQFEDALSPGAARNAGIAATRSPIVAFLASDCLAEPGWIAKRLARHRAGHAAVAGAAVNGDARNPYAWAAHLSTHAQSLPGVPEESAVPCGASYERSLFARYGLFLEDIGTAEDTEFHRRLPPAERPVWAPEIRTIHRHPTSFLALISDQFRRGRHAAGAARVLGVSHRQLAMQRYRTAMSLRKTARGALNGAGGTFAIMAWPLGLSAAAAYHAGVIGSRVDRWRAEPSSIRGLSVKARQAQKRRDWSAALAIWQDVLQRQPDRIEAMRGRALMLHRLKRHEEALTAFSSIVDRHPGDVAAHRGLASVLAALRDWKTALGHWETVLRYAPDDQRALNGKARALLELGRIDEAEAAFRALSERHPDHADGLSGLLEVMTSRHDHAGAIAVAEQLWRRHRSSAAAARLVTSLVHLGRSEKAESFIQDIEDGKGEDGLVAELKSTFYRSSFQWTRLADFLSANRSLRAKGERSFAEEVDSLLIVGRIDDLRRLLEESPPAGAARMDASMVLAIAKVFGRARVRETLMPLLRPPSLWNLSSSVLQCAVAAAEESDHPVLADAFHHLAEAGPFRCRDRTLPLIAPFAAAFHASVTAVRGLRPWPPSGLQQGFPLEEHLRLALQRTGTGDTGERRLLDFAERFHALRRIGRPLYPHVSADVSEALTVADAIVEAIKGREPLSVIRLGDGEGSFLPCPADLERYRSEDQAHFFNAWWGRAGRPDEIAYLEAALAEAVERADIVGIPDLEQLSSYLAGLPDERLMLPQAHMMRGYARVLGQMLDSSGGRAGQMLTSSHFHQSFVTWRLWELLFRHAGSCSLITCHRALSAQLAGSFGIRVERTYRVPPEAKWAGAFAEAGSGRHFPDYFMYLRDKLEVRPGDLYLVAAGILGKIYCQWIKSAGGIAIDIGSLADHWCGYRTRYTINALQTISPVSIEDYERLAASDRHIDRLLHTPILAPQRECQPQ